MSEALLFGPYGDIRDFVVAGERRGTHETQARYGNPDDKTYVAHLNLKGILPVARVIPVISMESSPSDPRFFGPRVSVEALSAFSFLSRSTGWEFLDAFIDKQMTNQFMNVEKVLRSFSILPHPDGYSQIRIVVRDIASTDALARAIALARMAIVRGDALVGEMRSWPDAAQRQRAEQAANRANSDDDIDRVFAAADRATAWMSGITERVKDDVECAVRLPTDVDKLDGTIRVRMVGKDGAPLLSVSADCMLPEVDVKEARLEPEETGIKGWFKRLGEIEIGDDDVDDMFCIFAKDDAAPILLRAKRPLLALGQAGATVRLSPQRLAVTADDISTEGDALERVVEAMGILWRECSEHRAGLLNDAARAKGDDG